MRPRRMDGASRPAGAPPPQQPAQRPAPVQHHDSYAQRRHQAAAAGNAQSHAHQHPHPHQQTAAAPQRTAPAPAPAPAKGKAKRRGGGWKVAAQFVVGLLVIALVAGAIVWLYVRYYQ